MFFNAVYGIFCLLFSYLPSNIQDQLSVAQCQSTMELHSTYVWRKPEHDFQTDGSPASWFPEHPKQWGSEIARIEFPPPTRNRTSYPPDYISLSDDDRLLAIAMDGDIHVYTVQRSGPNGDKVDLQQKRILHSAHGGGSVTFVEFQPGGSGFLVSSGMSTDCWAREYTIKSWNMNMDEEEEDSLALVAEKAAAHASQLLSHQNLFTDIDIARGFEAVLRDVQLKVDIENGSALRNAMVRRRAFSHDGSFLIVFPGMGFNGGSVTVVTVDGFHERYQLVGHSDNVMWAEFSPDDRFIATSSFDGTVRIWNAVNGDILHIIMGAFKQSWEGSFSPDGKLIAVGAMDDQVYIWNIESGKLLQTLHGSTGWRRSFHFSPDGKMLAAGGIGGGLRVFDISTGECLQYWQAADSRQHDMEVADVQYTSQGLLLFKLMGHRFIFDAKTNQKGQFEDEHDPIWDLSHGSSKGVASSDGTLLFTSNSDCSVRVWRL